MRSRRSARRSVNLKIFLLLVVPLVSVLALWSFAAILTTGEALTKVRTDAVTDNVARPLGGVHGQFAPESLLSVVAMGTGAPADRRALVEQRARTDAGLAALRNAVSDSSKVGDAVSEPLLRQVEALLQQFGRLGEIRAAVDTGSESRLDIIAAYGELVDAALKTQIDVALEALVDTDLYRETSQVVSALQAVDIIAREQAVVLGAVSSGARSLSPADRAAFGRFVANHRLLLRSAAANEDPTFTARYQRVLDSSAYAALVGIEDRILDLPAGAPLAVDVRAYQAAGQQVQTEAGAVTNAIVLELVRRGEESGQGTLLRLGLAGGLGLVAVLLSLLLSVRLGRGLSRELRGLQGAARDLADERLPRIMERLRNEELVDPVVEAPGLVFGQTAEVARVGEAFTTVQRTAVEAAIGQANLRRGVRQVFLNLARRSQSLVHRQLAMLDSMERKTSDPDALEELFRLDHLTTRMRRHAENLIILSGALPARAWSTPVRVVDVVRAAVSEVESYTRVRVVVRSEASLLGAVVADVTHLVAELVENAAGFSPPHTLVQVRAQSVSNGFVVEIEDAGLGMGVEQLGLVNARLASPPDFDLADTDRLGLFVVATLAARHGIRVTLRVSPYGGTTAIVLLPAALVVPDPATAATGEGGDGRWARASLRRTPHPGDTATGSGGGGGVAALDANPDTPALTGRHRRIAGFLQRTRGLPPSGPAGRRAPAPQAELPRAAEPDQRPWADHGGPLQPNGPAAAPRTDPADPDDRWARPAPYPVAEAYPGMAQYQPPEQPARPYAPPPPSPDATPGGFRPSPSVQQPAPEPVQPRASTEWLPDGNGRTRSTPQFDLWAATESSATSAGTHAGLPRRVRRASLAPQLRADPPEDGAEPAADVGRSPEQARALMSSMQSGWRRGRADDEAGADAGANDPDGAGR